MAERTEEILAMDEAGFDAKQIADEIGMSAEYVRQVLKAEGKDTTRKPTVLPSVEDSIIDDYIGDMHIPELLQKYDITYTKLYGVLRRRDVPLRSAVQEQARVMQLQQAVQMYKDGAKLYAITEETGIAQPTLHAELHKQSIPLRRPRK